MIGNYLPTCVYICIRVSTIVPTIKTVIFEPEAERSRGEASPLLLSASGSRRASPLLL